VLDADEVFLTNVIMQVMPVTRVEQHTVGSGQVGPVSRSLLKHFEECIKSQCEKRK
jgi:branched-subunit amino acid aminotransferase/4-amino-4-deoxychorismate lyase